LSKMDAALKFIMDQFRELKMDMGALGTGQEALKNDIGDIVEEKVGNCMSTIIEGLKLDMNDLRSEVSALESRMKEGQAEMEGRLERQQKEVASLVEQQAWHLREDIEATRSELEARLAAVDVRSSCASGGSPGAKSNTEKPPKFDGATSCAVFHRQFEAAALQNNWTSKERAAHLLSVLQGKAADILHTVPAEVTYKDIVGALRDRFGDHQLAAAAAGERRDVVGVRSSCGAAGIPSLCGSSRRLHSNRGRPLFHRRRAGPGSEAAPFNGRRPDPE
jgi:hypothetical protein